MANVKVNKDAAEDLYDALEMLIEDWESLDPDNPAMRIPIARKALEKAKSDWCEVLKRKIAEIKDNKNDTEMMHRDRDALLFDFLQDIATGKVDSESARKMAALIVKALSDEALGGLWYA